MNLFLFKGEWFLQIKRLFIKVTLMLFLLQKKLMDKD